MVSPQRALYYIIICKAKYIRSEGDPKILAKWINLEQ